MSARGAARRGHTRVEGSDGAGERYDRSWGTTSPVMVTREGEARRNNRTVDTAVV
jgi:hypothetical protein